MASSSPPTESWVALLGRRDSPTDGVEDYCTFLGEALERWGVRLEKVRVGWNESGWWSALMHLRRASEDWQGKWVLLQYTALGWSRRGFPFGALAALSCARARGARCGVVFHEEPATGGPRLVDRFRGACQKWVARRLYRRAEKIIVTAPVESVHFLPRGERKMAFIPIGANLLECTRGQEAAARSDGAQKTVAVFCLSDPPNLHREVSDISHAMRMAAMNGDKPRVVFLGRGTAEAQKEIERAFERAPVEVANLGLRSAAEVAHALAEADAMLCVRGELFPSRGSAIAGVACGLPIIAYGDAARSFPLSQAGVQLVPYGDREALGAALKEVLTDEELRGRLRLRSCAAQEKYFSWGVIAEKFAQALNEARPKE